MADPKDNVGNIKGFHSPIGKGPARGDAADASPPATPIGPPPDPIGNIKPLRPGHPSNLPETHTRRGA